MADGASSETRCQDARYDRRLTLITEVLRIAPADLPREPVPCGYFRADADADADADVHEHNVGPGALLKTTIFVAGEKGSDLVRVWDAISR